jgi:hypothetical protein
MQNMIDRPPWRANFVDTLHLLGQAVTRLPFGVPDPVLRGAAAVELYTGSLWPAAAPELLTVAARPLIAELFAVGFRWGRPGHPDGGVWHPELQIGVDIIERRAAMEPSEVSNLLAVTIDRRFEEQAEREPVSVKVIGIEDLITEQVTFSLTEGAPSRETATRVRVLTALGRAGVGGRFQVGYLQRRLAWETSGEVVLDAQPGEEEGEDVGAARTITLSQMRTLIGAWLAKNGFSFVRSASQTARGRDTIRIRQVRCCNDEPGREGGPSAVPTNVVPFGGAAPIPHPQE